MCFLKKYPIPIAGLILSLFALGNLLMPYGKNLRLAVGIIGLVLYLVYLAKLIFAHKPLKEELANPVAASVFLTFTMATMLLAVYVKVFLPAAAYIVWYAGLCGHSLLIILFSIKFLSKFSIKKVFPSWYIVYVGIAAASITAPAFKQELAGKAAFWFAFITYFLLLPVVLYRIIKVKEIPAPAKPSLIIIAAPASLLLAGYLACFAEKNPFIVYLLLTMSIIFYSAALACLPHLLKQKFTPGYSAFTFPLVISAAAIKAANLYFNQANTFLRLLARFEEIAAVLIVAWVLVCYSVFLFMPDKLEK